MSSSQYQCTCRKDNWRLSQWDSFLKTFLYEKKVMDGNIGTDEIQGEKDVAKHNTQGYWDG
jgi:hypothetical protein